MNFIDNIEIKNFKSIRHQKIEGCKRVNVFIGYPNVGKSNILEGIGLYSFTQYYNNENPSLKSLCRFNHLSDLNFDKDIKNSIHVGINKKYELFFEKKHSTSYFELGITSVDFNKVRTFFSFDAYNNVEIPILNPLKKYDVDDKTVYSIKYYTFDKNAHFDKIKSPSLSIPSGDNLLDILKSNSDLRKEYSELLKINNLKLNISDNDIAIAKDLTDGTYVSFKHNLVSDTLRRLFFYKAAIETNKNSVLLFEEPEANMFPPYISKFTSDIINDENKNQFFLTTHSPFVLNDLIDNVEKDELAVYIVSYEKETGETLVHRMNDNDIHEAYQFGYDFFMNIDQFIPHKQHG